MDGWIGFNRRRTTAQITSSNGEPTAHGGLACRFLRTTLTAWPMKTADPPGHQMLVAL